MKVKHKRNFEDSKKKQKNKQNLKTSALENQVRKTLSIYRREYFPLEAKWLKEHHMRNYPKKSNVSKYQK